MAVETYEQVPYPSKPYQQSTPSRMAVIAQLFGMTPPDPTRARVLEIGCAGGGNIIPRALEHPDSTWLGIDPALPHVREGQQMIYALGLDNIEIEHRGIEDLSDDEGPFDYIIAHGVFSWVPDAVRTRMLERIRALLRPNGVAYISFNTLPGWHMRAMVRDAMLFHTQGMTDPEARIHQARAMLEFLAESAPEIGGPWGAVLSQERGLLSQHGDSYLFHDHLAPDNEPLYLFQFVQRAQDAGLAWLGEAELCDMMTLELPADIRDVLEKLSEDLVRTQQYLDFLVNRTFRHSLLVHREVTLDRSVSWQRLQDLWVGSTLRRAGGGPTSLKSDLPVTFQRGSLELTTSDPAVKAGWLVFQDHFAEPLAFEAWVEATCERLRAAGQPVPDDVRAVLGRNLLFAYAQDLAELWPHPIRLGDRVARRPQASAFARLQALGGSPWGVTSRRHEGVVTDALDRHLLMLCDGTRDEPSLLDALVERVESGELALEREDGEDASPSEARRELQDVVAARLLHLTRLGLFEPPPETE